MINSIEPNYNFLLKSFAFEKPNCLSYEQLREQVIFQKIKSGRDYNKNYKKFNWPSNPYKTYKNKGWKNWDNFLGKEKLSYEQLREQVVFQKFKSRRDYNKNYKKFNWPSSPNQTYKNKGWENWDNFLGKLSYEQLREQVIFQKIKSGPDYEMNYKKFNWPSNPNKTYKNKGWENWDNFLGKEKKLSYEQLREQVIFQKIKSGPDYNKNYKKFNWPSNPYKTYKNKGWENWDNFLGKNQFI